MGRFEYRIEQLAIGDEQQSRLRQLVERLNELGAQGWRVASVDLTPRPSFEATALPVLLEREATEATSPGMG